MIMTTNRRSPTHDIYIYIINLKHQWDIWLSWLNINIREQKYNIYLLQATAPPAGTSQSEIYSADLCVCTISSRAAGGRWIRFCLIRVYWILSSRPSSNDQSALMLPYCVYKCKLIHIAAKRPQDSARAPSEPNTNYMYVSGETATHYNWSMLNSKRSKHISAKS